MIYSNTTTIINSPLQYSLLIKRASNLLRETRREWYKVRDRLSVQENAEYLDKINAMRVKLWGYQDQIKEYQTEIQAQLN